jgi:hypothetical protein
MRTVISVIAHGFGVLLALFGLLWFLQGIGVVLGSPMSNTTTWTVIGPITAMAIPINTVIGWRARKS